MISTSAWSALKKASNLTLETVVECGLKCLNMKEECGAIHYHEETKTCTMAQVGKRVSSERCLILTCSAGLPARGGG